MKTIAKSAKKSTEASAIPHAKKMNYVSEASVKKENGTTPTNVILSVDKVRSVTKALAHRKVKQVSASSNATEMRSVSRENVCLEAQESAKRYAKNTNSVSTINVHLLEFLKFRACWLCLPSVLYPNKRFSQDFLAGVSCSSTLAASVCSSSSALASGLAML